MRVFDTESFIKKSLSIHGDKYDYSQVDYFNSKSKVILICQKHGDFTQQPNSHISGKGCPSCNIDRRKITKSIFLERAFKVHGNLYTYDLSNINGVRSKVEIKCVKHGTFLQMISHHLYGEGCPRCVISKGELLIENYLKSNGFYYLMQHSFPECVYKRELKFDFYLPDINTCIEYDGIRHYNPIFGIDKLNDVNVKDDIKNKFCDESDIRLIRISYKDNILERLLDI